MIPDASFSGSAPINMVTIAGQSWAAGAASATGQAAISTSPTSRALYFNRAQRDIGSGITGVEDLRSLAPLREAAYTQNSGTWTETAASGFAAQVAALSGTAAHRLLVGNWGRGSADYSVLAKGTSTYARGIAMVRSGRQQFREFKVRATLALHGGSDSNSATYQTDMRQWQVDWETDVNALAGQTGTLPWLVTQPPGANGAGAVVGTVGLLEEFKTNPTKTVLVGPTYFLPVGADNIHYASLSSQRIGEYLGWAYYQHIIQGTQWNPLRPTTITRSTNVVLLTFADAIGNLVLDATNVLNPGNYGFEWNDDSAKTISAVRLVGGNVVEITLSGTPTINGNTKIRYGYTATSGATAGPQLGPRGNLRDSNPMSGALSGQPLYKWCCNFNETVT